MAFSVLTLTATILATDWYQAMGTGFGTVDWQRHIFAAQKNRDIGQVSDADRLLNQAFQDAKRLGKQHPFYSVTLRHLSDAAFYKYDFKTSRDYAVQELEVLKPLGEEYQDLVPLFMRMGDIAYMEGNLTEAKVWIEKARVLKDKALFNPTLKAEIKLRLAMIEIARNHKEEFRSFVRAAEKDWVEMLKEPKAGSNLSDYSIEVGRMSAHANKKVAAPMREAARYMAVRAVYLIKTYQGVDTLGIIWGLSRLGEIYKISNRPLDEIECFRKGSAYAIASKGLTIKDKAIVLYQYGQPLVDQGYFEEALPMLRQSELYSRKVPNEDFCIDILYYLAFCLKKTNHPEEALAFKRQLINAYERMGRHAEAQQQLREIDADSARIK